MNIFTVIFLQNFTKIFSKTHQLTQFLKIFSEEHAPEARTPLGNAWLRHALHGNSAVQITSLLQKYFDPPPPPPPPPK